ncbi:MAG: DMT family transporter [Proteobacteria bacterium]|nr:DMT family transporter [Pseudomonadota bacterium]
MLAASAPIVFVFIWSTGWVVAKYAMPYADPLTFLFVRYVVAALLLGGLIAVARARLPQNRAEWFHAVFSGVFLHALYLGGVWWAIARGVPAGISALIAALQPLITLVLATALKTERPGAIQMAGILLGFMGVLGVVWPKLAPDAMAGAAALGPQITLNALAMVSVVIGTLYQKRYLVGHDLRSVAALQYVGAALATLPLALLLEPMRFEPVTETWLALAWSVLVLSIGAIMLMLWMIRRGAVSKLASLIYLVPPVVALQAYAMFGETLMPVQILFMGVTALGVYLANRK